MTSALEEIKSIDIEEWLTLNTASSPTKLLKGQTPNMQNCWVDEKPGSVITAPAYKKVGTIPSNNPIPFCINYFKTSSGTQTFVVSDNSTVWTTVDFQNFTSIITGLSSAFQLRGLVIRDKLWLTNGSDAVRVFDGTIVTVLDGSGSTPNVPKGRYIAYHDERVWLYHLPSARSQCAFSALTDSSANIIAPDNASAWPTSNTLQISEGDADFGTGLLLYNGYLHFFKQYSIWRLVGYDEYSYTRVKTRASTGSRFNESIQVLDSLVHLIGVDGLYIFDGDTTVRISDIIDPATASQTAFGFNQLQQPNTNNQFWEVTDTADWNTGNVPTNLSVADQISLIAADGSQADFQAGVIQTNLDLVSNPGAIQLSRKSSGVSSQNIALNAAATLSFFGASQIGSSSFVTDGSLTNAFGMSTGPGGGLLTITIPLPATYTISRVILKGVTLNDTSHRVFTFNAGSGLITPTAVSSPGSISLFPTGAQIPVGGPTDYQVDLTPTSGSEMIITIEAVGSVTLTEIQVFATAFNSTGKFTSKILDLGAAPISFGNFNSAETLNGETTAYFTQSSNDGSSWDSEIPCTNGGAIGSALKRYLRWGVNLTSDGLNTPVITSVYLPSQYLSVVHDTGGSIFSWGPFEADDSLFGQTVNFYYRGDPTPGGVSSASWNFIVPGGVLVLPVSNRYIQFKIEILSGDVTHLPTITSVTINWVSGTGVQPQTLQNVASAYWRNRYWLAAAGPGATSNDTILIRGKKTFNSPWMLKDWNILSFTRYFDSLYGGSSVDGSILQLDSGYSKAGAAMDSFFETGDFIFGGFTANLIELLVEAERTGPWNLLIGVSLDRGNTWDDYPMDLTPSLFDASFIKRINLSYTTDRFRLRFRVDGVDMPFQVHRCVAFYKMESERGSIRGDYLPS